MKMISIGSIEKGMIGCTNTNLLHCELAAPMSLFFIHQNIDFLTFETRSEVSCPILGTFTHLYYTHAIWVCSNKLLTHTQIIRCQMRLISSLAVIGEIMSFGLIEHITRIVE